MNFNVQRYYYHSNGTRYEILAIIDGWAMLRIRGRAPFIEPLDWFKSRGLLDKEPFPKPEAVKKPDSWVEYFLPSSEQKVALFLHDPKDKIKAKRIKKEKPPTGHGRGE